MHPTDLSLNTNYQVYFQLKNLDGDVVGDSLSVPTNNEMSVNNPKLFKWVDNKTIAMGNEDEDVILVMTIQTEQHGITKGVPIATG